MALSRAGAMRSTGVYFLFHGWHRAPDPDLAIELCCSPRAGAPVMSPALNKRQHAKPHSQKSKILDSFRHLGRLLALLQENHVRLLTIKRRLSQTVVA